MFGLSNESQYSPRESNRSRLNSYDLGAKHEDGYRCDDADGFHKVIVAVAIPEIVEIVVPVFYDVSALEEHDHNVLRSAPQNKFLMPSQRNLKEWYNYITGGYRI